VRQLTNSALTRLTVPMCQIILILQTMFCVEEELKYVFLTYLSVQLVIVHLNSSTQAYQIVLNLSLILEWKMLELVLMEDACMEIV